VPIIFADKLGPLVEQILTATAVVQPIAERCAQHLVDANLAGVDSHGVMRLPDYVEMVQQGKMAREDCIEVVRDEQATALLDAHSTFGQMAAWKATEIAISKARQFGIGLVSTRNSAHIGRLGEYAEQMVKQNLIGFICCNLQGAGQRVAPWGGREGRLSTNPIAWGVPTGGNPMIIDMSTAVSAEGKIRVKMRRGEELPPGWLLDRDGEPTTDPSLLYGPTPGAILTTGQHKGYGLSLVVEALAGALSGGGVSHADIMNVAQSAFSVIAIKIEVFNVLNQFTHMTDMLTAHVKNTRPIEPNGEILIPYEPEIRSRQARLANGIPIEEESWLRIANTANSLGVSVD
jgi:hydroxycarboxylate dehydrogenase B